MKCVLQKLAVIGAILFSADASTDDLGMTPGKLKVYVEALRALKEPVSSTEVIAALKPMFNNDVKVKEALMNEPNPERILGIWLEDRYTYVNVQLPSSPSGFKLPIFNAMSPAGQYRPICTSDSKQFENLKIDDLIKMYGSWTQFIDGSHSEYRRSLFTFKSGELEIDASGCYRADTDDIRVHMLYIKWLGPERTK